MKNKEGNNMKDEYVYIFLHLSKTGGTTINGHLHNHLEWDEEFVHIGPWGNSYREDKGKEPFHKRDLKRRNRVKVLAGHDVYYGIHRLVPDKIPRYFTVIRDPADRLVSLYNHSSRFKNPNKFFKSRSKNDIVKFYYVRFVQDRFRYIKYLYSFRHMINNNISSILKPLDYINSENFWEIHCFNQVKKKLNDLWKIIPLKYLDNELEIIFNKIGVPSKNWKNYRVSGKKESSVKDIFQYAKEEDYVPKRIELDDEIRKQIYKRNPLDKKLYDYFEIKYEQDRKSNKKLST